MDVSSTISGMLDFAEESTNELFGLPAGSKGVGQHLLDECDLGNSDRLSPIAVPDEVLARRTARLQGKAVDGIEVELVGGGSQQAMEESDEGYDVAQHGTTKNRRDTEEAAVATDDDDDAAPFRTLEELIADAEARKSFVLAPRATSQQQQAAAPAQQQHDRQGTSQHFSTSDEAEEMRRQILALRGTINALTDRLEGVCALSAMQYNGAGVANKQPRVLDISAASLCTSVYPYAQQYAAAIQGAATGFYPPPLAHMSADELERAPPARTDVLRREGGDNTREGGKLTTRHEHYALELQRFYEAVYNVKTTAEVRPSGAVTINTSVPEGVDPLTYALNRQVLYEKMQNVELLLSKFHGFEEDLFRLLKAKYNTPLYRFEHF